MCPFKAKPIMRELAPETRTYERSYEGFLAQLDDPDPVVRRRGARDLVQHPESAARLLAAFASEADRAARDAMLSTLVGIGTEEAARGLFPHLRSEVPERRNAVIEALASMPPDVVAPLLDVALADADPDVRIFAVGIAGQLPSASMEQRLARVLEDDAHLNVVAAAADALAELGGTAVVSSLERAKVRFPKEPYLSFTIDLALKRISGRTG